MKQTKQNSAAALPIMDAEAIRRALRRIAHEIVERNPQITKVVLAGIPSRGVEIARRIAAFIYEIEKIDIETGVIDVAMHRDDVGRRPELPVVRASKLPLPLEERTVIIVDDVLYTGRTVRAAMDAINSFGRPARIQLAALVDRGHRELPIRPDYVGKNLPTASGEQLQVRLLETDNKPDAVWLDENERANRDSRYRTNHMTTRWTRKDLLGLRKLSADEINFVLETADAFKQIGTREIKT